MYAVARNYDISPKADRGRHYYQENNNNNLFINSSPRVTVFCHFGEYPKLNQCCLLQHARHRLLNVKNSDMLITFCGTLQNGKDGNLGEELMNNYAILFS